MEKEEPNYDNEISVFMNKIRNEMGERAKEQGMKYLFDFKKEKPLNNTSPNSDVEEQIIWEKVEGRNGESKTEIQTPKSTEPKLKSEESSSKRHSASVGSLGRCCKGEFTYLISSIRPCFSAHNLI